jgi:hypothetical protein
MLRSPTLLGQGRRGVVALRDAIADWSIDQKPADSVLETVMARLIARAGLPPVEFHPIIEGHEVDFRVIGTPVILECDGWKYHGSTARVSSATAIVTPT